MKTNDALEEGTGHGRGSIRMPQRDEVGILGEAVDHSENGGLAAHLGKALDEVHGDIRPNLRQHLQRLK